MIKREYSYEDIPYGVNQYANTDFSNVKIVEAKYAETFAYAGNPYIEALPMLSTEVDDVIKMFMTPPKMPPTKTIAVLPKQAKLDIFKKAKDDLRIPLPFHKDLLMAFDSTIKEGYDKRMECKLNEKIKIDGQDITIKTGLQAYHPGEAIDGFALLGLSGIGKSTAVNTLLDQYPNVIIHHFGDETVIQIVYLKVTCKPNKNFDALYDSIAEALDKTLCDPEQPHLKDMKKTRGLAQKSMIVQEYIDKFAIGVIIFDEIQNIDLKSASSNSIEALLTINNDTHVGMGVLGTEESFHDLFERKDRTGRRLPKYIPAGRYIDDPDSFYMIIRGLFTIQPFEPKVKPDADIIKAFYDESAGIIGHVFDLYPLIVEDYIMADQKPVVNGDYIRKIAVRDGKTTHNRVAEYLNPSNLAGIEKRKLIGKMNSEGNTAEIKQADEEFVAVEQQISNDILLRKIADSISGRYPQYNIEKVENAVEASMNKGLATESDITAEAIKKLKSGKTDKRSGNKSPKISSAEIRSRLEKCE